MTSPPGRSRGPRILVERALPKDCGQIAPQAEKPAGRPRPARSVTVNLAESPLSWLRSRAMISERQFEAGEALRADYERSNLPPRITMQWDAAPRAPGTRGPRKALDPGEAQLAAKARFQSALAMLGPGLQDIVWRILCDGEGLKHAEAALGWPARAGKLVLQLALDRLADHYCLPGK